MAQKLIFALQLKKVFIAASTFNPLIRQEAGLSHEKRFHLHQIVAMLTHCHERHRKGPLLKGIAVYAKPESTCKGHEKGMFQVAFGTLQIVCNAQRLLFQTFHTERTEPGMSLEQGQMRNNAIAGGIFFFSHQFLVILPHIVGDAQLQLRHPFATLGKHIALEALNHMENHVLIGLIAIVTVTIPVGTLLVYFHIAHPQHAIELYFCIEKVGTGIVIVQAHIDYLDRAAIVGDETRWRKEFVFPNVVKRQFHME